VLIRDCTISDVPEVLRLWEEATTEPSATDDPAAVETLLEFDPAALLVAVEDSRIVGTVIASWDGWRGTMYRLAVLPAQRRRGVATRLTTAGEERLRGRGARRLHMIVGRDQPVAAAFWESVGYTTTRQLRYVKTISP